MSRPVFNKKTVKFLVELEKEFNFLSCDGLDQTVFFEIQERLYWMMCDTSNDDKTGWTAKLLEELPYLFKIS